MRRLILIAHNLRSAHNVGSLLRTCEGLGVKEVLLSGHTPYPMLKNDPRLPHLARKIDSRIAKTALGAEKEVKVSYQEDVFEVIHDLKQRGYTVAGLEQTAGSIKLNEYESSEPLALLVGREVEGIESEVLSICDLALEIPMLGQKESYNVAVAAAMALYHLRFRVGRLSRGRLLS